MDHYLTVDFFLRHSNSDFGVFSATELYENAVGYKIELSEDEVKFFIYFGPFLWMICLFFYKPSTYPF